MAGKAIALAWSFLLRGALRNARLTIDYDVLLKQIEDVELGIDRRWNRHRQWPCQCRKPPALFERQKPGHHSV